MSVHGTGNTSFMSNAYILGWMETKTEGIYGHMREAMDTSNTRGEAEEALNGIKAQLLDAKAKDGNMAEVFPAIAQALEKYGDVPEVAKALQGMNDELTAQYQAAAYTAAGSPTQLQNSNQPTNRNSGGPRSYAPSAPTTPAVHKDPEPVKIGDEQLDAWTKFIDTGVDAMGKQDQLGLINIQEFNAQLNQAKQTASALMDAADKAASSIINHIA